VFFCDISPGDHVVSVTTETEKIANVDIAAGQASYVKMDAGFGWIVAWIHLEIVPPETGAAEAGKASLIKPQRPMG